MGFDGKDSLYRKKRPFDSRVDVRPDIETELAAVKERMLSEVRDAGLPDEYKHALVADMTALFAEHTLACREGRVPRELVKKNAQ